MFSEMHENSECIIHPERCQGHLGGGRDPEWEAMHRVKPHIVYLSQTSGIKLVLRETMRFLRVGLTKERFKLVSLLVHHTVS